MATRRRTSRIEPNTEVDRRAWRQRSRARGLTFEGRDPECIQRYVGDPRSSAIGAAVISRSHGKATPIPSEREIAPLGMISPNRDSSLSQGAGRDPFRAAGTQLFGVRSRPELVFSGWGNRGGIRRS